MPHTTPPLQTALAHHQSGQWGEAESAYRKVLDGNAGDSEALRLLGGLYLQAGRWEQASEFLGKAVTLRPNDAETMTNWGLALRGLGKSDKAANAFRLALEINPNHLFALTNLAGTHQVMGREDEAIACFQRALKLDPDNVEAISDLAMALSQVGRGEEAKPLLGLAQTRLEKICADEPGNLDVLNRHGTILQRLGRLEEAANCYRQALHHNPDFAPAAANLSIALRDLQRLEEAVEMARNALRLTPQSPDMHINLGVCLQSMMRHQEALDAFNQALRLNPASLAAKRNKSFSLLALGQYQEGFALHEAGIGVASMRGIHPFPERRWNGEDIKGKRLLIWCEQGLGDDLQFIRYAELCKARGCTVIVQCPQPLRRLFSNCPFIDSLPENVGEKDFDVHAPIMSLPYIFGTTTEIIPANIPYLHVSEDARTRWALRIKHHYEDMKKSPSPSMGEGRDGGDGDARRKFKIGLVWAGKPHETHITGNLLDQRRSIDLSMLLPLFDIADIEFYSLQLGASAMQIDKCNLRDRIIDMTNDIMDFEDTAALIENLDIVITVDTSVAHLAGGMGKPVWILSRFDADWRWLQNRADSPWYPTAQVFGQQSSGDWTGVVERVRDALRKTVFC